MTLSQYEKRLLRMRGLPSTALEPREESMVETYEERAHRTSGEHAFYVALGMMLTFGRKDPVSTRNEERLRRSEARDADDMIVHAQFYLIDMRDLYFPEEWSAAFETLELARQQLRVRLRPVDRMVLNLLSHPPVSL